MGDAARAPRPPPVTGAGEPDRDRKGPNAGCARSFGPSSCGDGEIDDRVDDVLLSSAPSVLGWWAAFGSD